MSRKPLLGRRRAVLCVAGVWLVGILSGLLACGCGHKGADEGTGASSSSGSGSSSGGAPANPKTTVYAGKRK